MMNAQSIILSKLSKISCDNLVAGNCRKSIVATILKNLNSLGYQCSKDLFQKLNSSSEESLIKWSENTLNEIKNLVGVRKFNPMYPNFPKQVLEASDSELYLNAVMNYLGFALSDLMNDPTFQILPQYEVEKRAKIHYTELNKLKILDISNTKNDLNLIFKRLVTSNGSLSEDDKNIIKFCLSLNNSGFEPLSGNFIEIPDEIPQKETLALVLANSKNKEDLIKLLKTATDVLRAATALCGGDVSLATKCKFKNISRGNRRLFLNCLNRIPNNVEDMARYPQHWIKLGEALHPGEYSKQYPEAAKAFHLLRNGKAKTFNSQVESYISKNDFEGAVKLLSKRPGDFARRLDNILRKAPNALSIAEKFIQKSKTISTPVLLQLWKHFSVRNSLEKRAIFPKGSIAKIQVVDKVENLNQNVCDYLHTEIRKILVNRFSTLPTLGKVNIDERLKEILVPFSQRSASKTIRNVSRGSKFNFDIKNKTIIRFFVYWKQQDNQRTDIDLSASIFDENWAKITDVAFYNLKSKNIVHSGDITSAPDGACEFIDYDLNTEFNGKKPRYLVMTINSYTMIPFQDLPECFAGWMIRNKPQSGEIFDARTVQEKVDITGSSIGNIPMIIDLKDNKIIWTDISTSSNSAYANESYLEKIGPAFSDMKKATLYDLFLMHKDAREDDKSEKVTNFDLNTGSVTAFDSNVIMSEFLK